MKKFWIAVIPSLFLGALLTTQSLSQQADILVSTDSLIGTEVKDAQGKDIGKVKKLLIEPTEGKISMVIVSFGGFLGIADKSHVIPWDSFEVSMNNKALVLKTTRETVERAQTVEKYNWPNGSEWMDKVKEYWQGEGNTREREQVNEPLDKK